MPFVSSEYYFDVIFACNLGWRFPLFAYTQFIQSWFSIIKIHHVYSGESMSLTETKFRKVSFSKELVYSFVIYSIWQHRFWLVPFVHNLLPYIIWYSLKHSWSNIFSCTFWIFISSSSNISINRVEVKNNRITNIVFFLGNELDS